MTTYSPPSPAPAPAHRRRTADGARPRPGPPPRTAKRRDIEGLRAVAVLLVVAGHARVGLFSGGYVGVDVFFVVSGFLITLHLAGELGRTGRIRFAAFYGRRMLRLLPASAVVVLATVAAAWAWLSPIAAKAVSLDALTAAVYGVNVRLAAQGTDYLSAEREASPLQHFWSLAVEEQFYLIWPLFLAVVLALGRGRRPAVLAVGVVAAGSFGVCVWQTGHAQPWAYFGLPARAWELAAGALVALAAGRLARLRVTRAVRGAVAWAGLALILAAGVLFDGSTVFPGVAAVVPVAGAVLVIVSGTVDAGGGRAVAVLDAAPMQAAGRLSYGWYLWHWPLLVLAPHVAGRELGGWASVAVAAAALLPAWLSLRVLEDPLRFHRGLRGRPGRALLAGGLLTAVTVGVAAAGLAAPVRVRGEGTARDTAAAVTAPDPGRQLLDLVAAGAVLEAMPANLTPPVTGAAADRPAGDRGCLASLDESSTAPALRLGCDRHGDAGAAPVVVMFGDSHMEQWFDAVDAVARQRHWRLVVLTKSGCTPADGLTVKVNARRPFTECARWRQEAFGVIARLRPVLVLMSARTYTAPPLGKAGRAGDVDGAWAEALMVSARRVVALGARVVVLQDTPDPRGVDVPDCLAEHPAAVRRCGLPVQAATYPARRAAIGAAARAAAGAGLAGVAVVDATPWFCTAAVCPAIVGNALVYRDGSHVTAGYIRLLTPLLDKALAQALQ